MTVTAQPRLHLSVLMVDDDRLTRELVRAMLRRMGITIVKELDCGNAAIAWLGGRGKSSDLVICDWGLPDVSGLDVLRAVRPCMPTLPFIMLTARNDENSVIRAKQFGVSAYLTKPFSAKDLEAKVRFAIARPPAVLPIEKVQ